MCMVEFDSGPFLVQTHDGLRAGERDAQKERGRVMVVARMMS